MKQIILNFLLIVCLCAGVFVPNTFGEFTALIDPDFDPPSELGPPSELVPPESPPPETVLAVIDVDPNTLNLKSNRNFITVYIELPAGLNASAIKLDSVKISAINGNAIAPIAALGSPTSIGDEDADKISDLMVKFDYNAVKPLILAEQVKFRITGILSDDKEFAGEDTINVIGLESVSQTAISTSAVQGKFRYSLSKHLPSDAKIKGALLWWVKHADQQGQTWQSWLYKALKEWESILGKFGILSCSNLKKGHGYEWNLTNQVIEDWVQGYTDVTVKFDEQGLDGYPVLVVTYEGAATTEIEGAVEKQNLKSLGRRFNLGRESDDISNVVTLSYTDSELQGINEKDLGVYCWDTSKNRWELVPGVTVNLDTNVLTFEIQNNTFYQLMGPKSQSAVNPEQKLDKTNTLGQNYPNPFNPGTTIKYSVAKDCHVTLKLYNVAGELVATVVDEGQRAGEHSVYFDGGERLSRGIYYYQLIAGDFVDTKRMVILK